MADLPGHQTIYIHTENAWEAETNAKILSLQGLCFISLEQHIQGTQESLTSGFLLVIREHARTFQIQCYSTLLGFQPLKTLTTKHFGKDTYILEKQSLQNVENNLFLFLCP